MEGAGRWRVGRGASERGGRYHLADLLADVRMFRILCTARNRSCLKRCVRTCVCACARTLSCAHLYMCPRVRVCVCVCVRARGVRSHTRRRLAHEGTGSTWRRRGSATPARSTWTGLAPWPPRALPFPSLFVSVRCFLYSVRCPFLPRFPPACPVLPVYVLFLRPLRVSLRQRLFFALSAPSALTRCSETHRQGPRGVRPHRRRRPPRGGRHG
jgi:hypothetical protein